MKMGTGTTSDRDCTETKIEQTGRQEGEKEGDELKRIVSLNEEQASLTDAEIAKSHGGDQDG
jgi:hypothetical protein